MSADAERDAWAVLGGIEDIGPATVVGLVAHVGGAAALLDLAARPDGPRGVADAVATMTADFPARRRAAEPDAIERLCALARSPETVLDRVAALGLAVMTLDDDGYPARLRAIATPPPVLYVQGDVRSLGAPRAVAVVGTRRPTEAGRRVAALVAGAIARAGAVVVSGLAVGIDGAAHAAAVAEAAPTVAVLGGGHARLFPRAHARLADLVAADGGAVVAEVAPDVEPSRWSFPRRNRIISGLAEATVVVEAAAKSGALITAAAALDQGRDCFIVPGPLDARTSAGCLRFLRDFPGAARIVAGIPELLEDLDLAGAVEPAAAAVHGSGALGDVGPVAASVALGLSDGATTVDELVSIAGQPVATVLAALTLLEMRGLAVGAYGRYRPAGRLASGRMPTRRQSARPSRDRPGPSGG